jgi:hypothetical protein
MTRLAWDVLVVRLIARDRLAFGAFAEESYMLPCLQEDEGDLIDESYVTHLQDEGDLINTLDCSSRKPDAQEQMQESVHIPSLLHGDRVFSPQWTRASWCLLAHTRPLRWSSGPRRSSFS